MAHSLLFISLACSFGFFMTWGVGANDLSNVISTTIGSRSIPVVWALFLAIVFEFAGALLGGVHVAQTVQTGIINMHAIPHASTFLVYGMLSALLASMIWMALASYLGMPVSITNAILGAVVGFGVLSFGIHAVYWPQLGMIVLSWILSPALAGVLSFLLFLSIQRSILCASHPAQRAAQFIPYYLFLIGFILSEITVIKLLQEAHLPLNLTGNLLIAILCGLLIVFIGRMSLARIKKPTGTGYREQFAYIEKLFGILMVLTVSAMVYAHGSNDVAISIGPIASVISLATAGHPFQHNHLLMWILAAGCVGVTFGLLTYGRKVIVTVGSNITRLTPSRAYCATIATATTVVISTSIGLPVSATQTLVGAVLGVGLARGIDALDLRVVRNIFISWTITIPVTATLATLFFYIFEKLVPLLT